MHKSTIKATSRVVIPVPRAEFFLVFQKCALFMFRNTSNRNCIFRDYPDSCLACCAQTPFYFEELFYIEQFSFY